MSGNLVKEPEYTKAAKNDFSEAAKYELRKLYEKFVDPNYTSLEEYIKMLQDWE